MSIDTLEQKINELKSKIKYRGTTKWGQSIRKDSTETNEYFWKRCGEREKYKGTLEGMEFALKILKGEIQ